MSDSEVFEEAPAPKVKAKKPRKPMSEERKQALREQLAKAREKSNEVRKKKALAKKIQKEDEQAKIDETIAKKVLKKSAVDDEITALKEEIKSLKASGGSNEEVKQLREELNLFKKGLAEQIEKAKKSQAKQSEPKITMKVEEEPKKNIDNNTKDQDVKPKEPEVATPPPKPVEKKFKTCYDKRRGIIKIPIN